MKPTIDSVEAVAKCGQSDARTPFDLAARQHRGSIRKRIALNRLERKQKAKKI
jgi:hypothetical protein